MRDVATSPGERLPPPSLTVRHATGHTPVHIGEGLLARLAGFAASYVPNRRLAIIADDQVARTITLPIDAPVVTFPAGEPNKTRDTWARLTDELLARGFGRDTALIALGGGVTGDMAGFVAATYLRGIPCIQVPTSLLAMVDASIGGKTAVDVPAGKNLVGAFHQAAAVVMDPAVLRTLPDRDLRHGLAEAVKHALISDQVHFAWLGSAADALLAREIRTVDSLLRRTVAIKAAVVEADERERGRRSVLNAGHTVAHALEAASGYAVGHGEAVAIGMVAETTLGERLGVTAPGTAVELRGLLERFALPSQVPGSVTTDALLAAMAADKKNRAGQVRFAFPARIGAMAGGDAAGWTMEATPRDIAAALDSCR
jgi:3-dehydroquinate synthase